MRFGDFRIGSLFFAVDGVLLAPLACELQLSLHQFAAKCKVARMKICTSKSEAKALTRKWVNCFLQVGEEILPQVEDFKYLGVLFTSKGKWSRRLTGGLVQHLQ